MRKPKYHQRSLFDESRNACAIVLPPTIRKDILALLIESLCVIAQEMKKGASYEH